MCCIAFVSCMGKRNSRAGAEQVFVLQLTPQAADLNESSQTQNFAWTEVVAKSAPSMKTTSFSNQSFYWQDKEKYSVVWCSPGYTEQLVHLPEGIGLLLRSISECSIKVSWLGLFWQEKTELKKIFPNRHSMKILYAASPAFQDRIFIFFQWMYAWSSNNKS